jgi:transposase
MSPRGSARSWGWPITWCVRGSSTSFSRQPATTGGSGSTHAAAWAKLSPRTIQSGAKTGPGKTGKGNPWLRGALGDAAMAAGKTDTYLGERYRRIRRRRSKQKPSSPPPAPSSKSPACSSPTPPSNSTTLGAGYYDRLDPHRQTRNEIRDIERLNPGMKVTLTPAA